MSRSLMRTWSHSSRICFSWSSRYPSRTIKTWSSPMTNSKCSHRTSKASPCRTSQWAYNTIALSKHQMKKVPHLNSCHRIIDRTSAPPKVPKTIVSFHKGKDSMRQFFNNLNSKISPAYSGITASITNKTWWWSKTDRKSSERTGNKH